MISLATQAGSAPSPFTPEQQARFDEGLGKAIAKYPPERRKAALLPALHLAQDELGWLPDAAMAYVGMRLDVPAVRVREVATFYTMYRIEPVGRHHIGVCNSICCWAMGSEKILEHCSQKLGIRPGETTRDGKFSLEEVACLASCGTAPAVLVNNFTYAENVTPQSLDALIDELGEEMSGEPVKILTADWDKPQSWSLATYGKYDALRKALKMQPQAIVDEVVKSNLRGRGGAGFPTGMKWNFVRKETSFPKYLVVNADEGEPGTFKDREILLRSPHMFVEGLIIGCFAVECHLTYVYCRGEFRHTAMKRLQDAVDEATEAGYIGKNILRSKFDLEVQVVFGAGAYICGEETALLESLEGRKGYPRLKPPFPANAGGGLFKQPTAVNNVETLANLPYIVQNGGEAFSNVGLIPKNGGTRLYAVSGHVKKPGVVEAPMGISFRRLLDDYCGGMREGSTLKAIIPGGSSSAIMTAEEADWASDFDTLKAKKTMAGSGGVVYLDQSVNMAHALANVMRFYAHESCGQCTPCREGTAWLSRLLDKIVAGKGEKTDVDNVHQIARQMEQKTICALADGAAMPAKSYIEKFRADFDALVRG